MSACSAWFWHPRDIIADSAGSLATSRAHRSRPHVHVRGGIFSSTRGRRGPSWGSNRSTDALTFGRKWWTGVLLCRKCLQETNGQVSWALLVITCNCYLSGMCAPLWMSVVHIITCKAKVLTRTQLTGDHGLSTAAKVAHLNVFLLRRWWRDLFIVGFGKSPAILRHWSTSTPSSWLLNLKWKNFANVSEDNVMFMSAVWKFLVSSPLGGGSFFFCFDICGL